MSPISNIQHKIRQYGFSNLLLIGIKKTGSLLGYSHEVYYLYSKKLDAKTPYRKDLPSGFVVEPLTIRDFEKATKLDLPNERLELYKDRFLAGSYLVYGIFLAQTLVYYFWLSFCEVELPYPLSEYNNMSLKSDQGYLVDGFCLPEYRGLGLHAYMGVFLMNNLHDQGKKEAITIIKAENRAAIVSQERIGFERSGRITFSGFGKWKKLTVHYD